MIIVNIFCLIISQIVFIVLVFIYALSDKDTKKAESDGQKRKTNNKKRKSLTSSRQKDLPRGAYPRHTKRLLW